MWMALLLLGFFLRYHLVILSIVFFISFPRLRIPQSNYFLYLLSQGMLILVSASGINKLNHKENIRVIQLYTVYFGLYMSLIKIDTLNIINSFET